MDVHATIPSAISYQQTEYNKLKKKQLWFVSSSISISLWKEKRIRNEDQNFTPFHQPSSEGSNL